MNSSPAAQRVRAQFILQQARQATVDFAVAVQDEDVGATAKSVRHIERVIKTMNHFLARCDDVYDVAAELDNARNELHQRLVAAPAGLGGANAQQ